MHRRTPLSFCLLSALMAGGVVSCSKPLSLEETRARATQARDEAKAAADAKNARAADKAAKRAEALAHQTDKRPECVVKAGTPAAACGEVVAAARQARRFANRADEEQRLADLPGSLKARAYRAARSVALKAALASLLAAGDASYGNGKDSKSAQRGIREAGDLAREVAQWLAETDAPERPGGPPEDWSALRVYLTRAQSTLPPVFGLFLAMGFTVSMQPKLALFEIEALDLSAIQPHNREDEALYWGLRGLILSQNGFPQTSIASFERAVASLPQWQGRVNGQVAGAALQC